MKISYNWLKEFTNFDLSAEELSDTLTMLGMEVDGILDYGKKYDKFIIAKVLDKEAHPDADKLSVCKVDNGTSVQTVVCGAPNVASGQKIVLGLEGAIVPSAGFALSKRKIRGVESNGMICSQSELELGDDHDGIWVLPEDAPIATPIAEYLGMNDAILDVSITPNKAECLSHLGIAREVAAKLGITYKRRDIKLKESETDAENSIKIIIENEVDCPRYVARVLRGAKIGESPEWLKARLTKLGLRPINAVVDVTNFVLMEIGQPLHAFDLATIEDAKIVVRSAEDGEKFVTLDSKERTLDSNMLMICDGKKPVAVAGVMGGENSEITLATQVILIESAFFNPSSIRRTAKKLAIPSDASYRFERGVDIELAEYAADRAAMLIAELTGATIEKGRVDVYPNKWAAQNITMRYERLKQIVGVAIEAEQCKTILSALGFEITGDDSNSLSCNVPSWRHDVSGEIDIIEEVARHFGYEKIENQFQSTLDFSGEAVPKLLAEPHLRRRISNYLISRGFNEVVTANQTDSKSAKFFDENPVEIANPLGEELAYMKPTNIISMLKIIEKNIRYGNHNLNYFSLGKAFRRSKEWEKTFVEGYFELDQLCVSLVGKKASKQWAEQERTYDYYDIKGIYEDLSDYFGFNFKIAAAKNANPAFSPNSLAIMDKKNEIGYFGEISKKALKHYDLEVPVFLLILDMPSIYNLDKMNKRYQGLSKFPVMQRDLAFIAGKDCTFDRMKNEIIQSAGNLLRSVDVFDIYEGKGVVDGYRSIAFNLKYSSPDRTLVDEEVDASINKIVKSIEAKFEAKLRQ